MRWESPVPTVRLSVQHLRPAMMLTPPVGATIDVPSVQFRCLVRLPNFILPQDAIVDTGAPHIIFPLALWTRFREGIDFEWLPFSPGVQSPVAQLTRWQFSFQMARFLAPLALMDYTTEIELPDVIAAFAHTDPPAPLTRRAPPPIIIGLWGGVLEGGRIAVERTPAGRVSGELAFS